MANAARKSEVRLLGVARRSRAALTLTTALQASMMMVLSLPASAQPPALQPQGGVVVGGAATISQNTTSTTINQTSQRAAVNWQSFNVGSQQTVTFAQPSSTSITLNRVVGPDPSQIAGHIDANGQVVLINQSGVVFTQGSQVNVAGLMVSAAGISTPSFMAGSTKFDQAANPNAAVVNRGTITIKQAGLAALVAPQVVNSGTIIAALGHVVLAGAKTVTLDMYGDGLLALDVTNQVTQAPVGTTGAGATALVTNSGAIIADGGTVQLTARAADGVVQNLVRAGGKISAATVGSQTGTVALNAIGGSIVVEGQLAATGNTAGTTGGAVEVLASRNVTVAAGATINVSGQAGGGVAAIGTTLARARGGPSVTATQTAQNVIVQRGATIAANATQAGNGGRITLLSLDTTQMDGAITATGGPQSGNGGFVEVSGTNLGMTASPDVSAAHGAAGTILLDPVFLDIVAGASGSGSEDLNFQTNDGTVFINDGMAGTPDTISNGVLNAFSGNVLLEALRTITVAGNVSVNITNGSLTLAAGGNLPNTNFVDGGTITVGTGAVLSASQGVVLQTGTLVGVGGTPLISVLGTISSSAGSVSLLAGFGGSVTIGAAGLLSAATGQRVSLQTDSLTVLSGAGSISAPSGTVEVSTATGGNTASFGSGGQLVLSPGFVNAVSASVLEVGAVTVNGTVEARTSNVTIADAVNLTGHAATLALNVDGGSVGETAAGQLTVGTLTGTSSFFDLSAGTNTIGTVGSYSAQGGDGVPGTFLLAVANTTTLAGPITSNTVSVSSTSGANIVVTGAVTGQTFAGISGNVAGTVTLASGAGIAVDSGGNVQAGTITMSAATGIALNGTAVVGATTTTVSLSTTGGGVTEATTATLASDELTSAGGIAGDVSLLGTANAVSDVDGVTVTPQGGAAGNFAMTDTSALFVGFAGLSASGNIYLEDSNPDGIEPIGPIVSATTGFASFQTDVLTGAEGSVTTGTFEFAPDTFNNPMSIGAGPGSLLNGLGNITSTFVRIGAVTEPGDTAPTTRASSVTLAGTFNALGRTLELDANGPITGTAAPVINVNSLIVSGTVVNLSDASNSVSNLGNVAATSFTLNDSTTLTVTGAVAPTVSAAITSNLSLTVDGAVSSPAITLTSGAITIPGSVGGTGPVALLATGTIGETGTLVAGTLTGTAPGGAILTGATTTTNQVTALGNFSAAGFTLDTAGDLSVSGAVTGGTNATILDAGLLTVSGSVAATAISLTGGNLTLPGAVDSGAAGTVGLVATIGSISETGSLTAATLTGSARGAADLGGTNTIATLNGFGAGGNLTLADTAPLTVIGAVSAGTSGTLSLTVGGALQLGIEGGAAASLNAGTISLSAAGAITETNGTLTTNMLGAATTGNGGTIFLANAANQIAASDGISATNGDVVLVDDPTLVLTGAYSGNNLFFEVTVPGGSLAIGGAVPATLTVPAFFGRITLVADTMTATAGSAIVAPVGTLELAPFSAIPETVLGAASAGTLNLGATLLGAISGGSNELGVLLLGAFTDATNVAPAQVVRASAITLAGSLDLSTTAFELGLLANGPIAEVGGVLTVDELFGATSGAGGDFSLASTANAIGQSFGITATNGNVVLVDGTSLTLTGTYSGNDLFFEVAQAGGTLSLGVEGEGVTPAFLQAADGGRVSLVADAIVATPENSVLANGGTVELAPFSAINVSLMGTDGVSSGLVLDATLLPEISTGTLLVGGFTDLPAGATAPRVVASSLSVDGTADLTGIAGALVLDATGAVTQPGGPLTVAQLGGSGGSVSLLNTANTIGTLGDFAATAGNFALADTGVPVIAGTVTGSGNTYLFAATGISLAATGRIAAGADGLVSVETNTLTLAGGATVTGGTFEFAPATVASTVTLGPGGALASLSGISTGKVRIGAVTLPGDTTPTTTAGAIVVAGTFDADGLPVELDATGPITGTTAPLVDVGVLSGNGGAWTLTAANISVAALGPISASSFVLDDSTALSVTGPVVAGSSASISAVGTLAVAAGGSVDAAAIGLSAGALSIAGLVTDGGAGTVNLVASGGGIAETGTLIAGTLTGSATGATSLTGTNTVATLGNFSADVFTLSDTRNLTVGGSVGVQGGTSATITDTGSLTVASGISAASVGLTAAAIAIPGLVTDGGAGTVNLIASGGGIAETGTLIAGTLTGSATGAANFSGTNTVATLGNFSADGFALTDTPNLTIGGSTGVQGGSSVTITDTGSLTVASGVSAATVGLTATAIVIPGLVTDGGAGTVNLTANGGGIAETGTLIAGTLTGSATGAASLTGTNTVATLGNFTADGFTLSDTRNLAVGGSVGVLGGPSASITDAGTLTVASGVSAAAVGLTATAIAIPGLVSDGGAGTVNLIASGGGIAETGTLIAGTLTGSATGAASLTGTNTVATLGNFSADGFALTDTPNLTIGGSVGLQGGSSAAITDTGSLTVASGVSAASVGLTATAISIHGLVSDGGAGTVNLIASGGGIAETGTLIAGTLTGSATGAANFTGTNTVATLGNFSADGFTLTDTPNLTVSGSTGVQGGSSVTIVDTGSLTVASGVSAATIGLTATAIAIPGLVSDGGAGTVNLIANGGGIAETGTLIAGTLTGSATGAANFSGTNTVATLGNFSADGFTLTDTPNLTVGGSTGLQGGSSATIADTGSLTVVSVVSATTIGLTAAAIAIPGLVTDGGAGTVNLIANGGGIAETGTSIAGTLTGSATGAASLTGTNTVATLGNFSADGFTLTDNQNLIVGGSVGVQGGPSASITDVGTVTVASGISAAAIGLTATAIAIPGLVSDGGAGTVNLIANGGGIAETGSLIAGTLTGNATGAATLTGTNAVATLGNFSAAGFTLSDGRALTVGGSVGVQGGSSATIADIGTLTVASGISAAAIGLTAAAIAIPGLVTDGGAGRVTLIASGGGITETGTLIAGTLTGNATGAATLTGTNTVATLGNFTADGFALSDTRNLTVGGSVGVQGGSNATIADTGTLTIASGVSAASVGLTATAIAIPGLVNDGTAGTVSLVASGGGITETGSLVAGTLFGSSTGAAALDGTNTIATLGNFTASRFLLTDGTDLLIAGTLTAPNITVQASRSQITLGNGAAIVTGGTKPAGAIVPADEPGNGAPGAYLQAAGFAQTGSSTVTGIGGGAATLQISATGNIGFGAGAGLQANGTWLILDLTNGTATGNVLVNALDLTYTTPGSANLTGRIDGIGGQTAALLGFIQPAVNLNYKFNNCTIAAVTCTPPPPPLTPITPTLATLLAQHPVALSNLAIVPLLYTLQNVTPQLLLSPQDLDDLLQLPVVSEQDY